METKIIALSFLDFSGFAGGSLYDHTGAASEFVCLSRDPDLITRFTSGTAYVYGSEYDTMNLDIAVEMAFLAVFVVARSDDSR